MIIHSRLARHISVLLGYFYPALASAKTAVQQDPTAFTQWMTYWVVMSVFAMAEIFVDFFVSWVPFYYEAKIVLIVWLAMPRYQGASQIYHRLLHPYLDKYEGDIDNGLEEMRAGASRRIQSLGASAASEIAKAVSRQSSSAKDLMFARVLGLAAAGGAEALGDRPVQSAPTSPLLRRAYEAEGGARESSRRYVEEEEEEEGEEEEDEEEITAANASMLLDFTEVMKVGVFVQARSFFAGENGDGAWRSQQIRLLHGTQCCITEDEGTPGAGTGGKEGGAVGVREEQRFQVLAVETEAHAQAQGAPLLVLRTDRGRVELAPPGRDDRDSMLIGFELLLSSFGNGSPAKESLFSEGGGGAPGGVLPDLDAAQHRSRRWEEGLVGRGGMTLESSEEESEGEEDEHRHR